MRSMFIRDLSLALNDALTKRATDLRLAASGRLYEPILVQFRDQIDALPEAVRATKPLADELSELDYQHDGYGGALWYLTESYLRAPSTPPEIIEAGLRLRNAFVPALKVLRQTYATEAAAARKRQPLLDKFRTDLEMFPLAPEGTLFDWASKYIERGIQLDETLSNRADLAPEAGGPAGALRSSVIGVLNRFRATLADEMTNDPNLPRDLDTKIFAYIDDLNAAREATLTRKPVAKPAAPAQPAPGWSNT